MTYKDELCRAMTMLGKDPKSVFIGYNVGCGGLANGTLKDVPQSQRIETPVAENLMMGLATGMALKGHKPVVYYERFDFILNAADAIVNHLDKIQMMSGGEYNPTVIIRVLVGGTKNPLFTGPTHTQDLTEAFKKLVPFPVIPLTSAGQVYLAYQLAYDALRQNSTMLIEYRDLYATTCGEVSTL
jgi:pyruvate/2-oxoglutarate/acetoin dehydrogenase E1 component